MVWWNPTKTTQHHRLYSPHLEGLLGHLLAQGGFHSPYSPGLPRGLPTWWEGSIKSWTWAVRVCLSLVKCTGVGEYKVGLPAESCSTTGPGPALTAPCLMSAPRVSQSWATTSLEEGHSLWRKSVFPRETCSQEKCLFYQVKFLLVYPSPLPLTDASYRNRREIASGPRKYLIRPLTSLYSPLSHQFLSWLFIPRLCDPLSIDFQKQSWLHRLVPVKCSLFLLMRFCTFKKLALPQPLYILHI